MAVQITRRNTQPKSNTMTKKEIFAEGQAICDARDAAKKNEEDAYADYIVARDAFSKATEKAARTYFASKVALEAWCDFLRKH